MYVVGLAYHPRNQDGATETRASPANPDVRKQKMWNQLGTKRNAGVDNNALCTVPKTGLQLCRIRKTLSSNLLRQPKYNPDDRLQSMRGFGQHSKKAIRPNSKTESSIDFTSGEHPRSLL